MNDITYAVSVDVNNPIIPYNVYVASVLDSNVRYLEITLYENGNVITLSNTATATASLVTDNVLVDDSVNCTISDNIITVPLEDLQRHGNLDVQVTVTEGTKVLAIPFPIQVRVTPNIAENAQIDGNSLGSYAEVVHEIAEARGTYTTLHDAIAAKAPLSTAFTFDSTTTNVVYNANNPKTIYLNAVVNSVKGIVITSKGNDFQYFFGRDGSIKTRYWAGGTSYSDWYDKTEKPSNKADEITNANKASPTMYPSIKAVVDYLVANYENLSNKKTTLTGNELSNDFYPTTKAVADALNAKAPASTAFTFDSTTATVTYNANNPKKIYLNATVDGENGIVLTSANNNCQYFFGSSKSVKIRNKNGTNIYTDWEPVSEKAANKTSAITASNKTSTDYYPSIKAVVDYLAANYEDLSNKLTSEEGIDSGSTDTKYPSAKAVYDLGVEIIGLVNDDISNVESRLVLKESSSNKQSSITAVNKASVTLYPSIKAVVDYLVANYENLSNKLTSEEGIDSNSTDTEYPSAKAVYDLGREIIALVNDDISNVESRLVLKESFSNKKTTITGYETSNQFYPTTKAVYDYGTTITNNIEDVKAYIGYTDGDILGLHADFENNQFTRLGAAAGLTAGQDFNAFPMYGQRRRVVVGSDGVIIDGYSPEDVGESDTDVDVMVYQPKFYYKVVPLKLEKQLNGLGYHIRKANYYISSTPHAGFKLHPLFYDANGSEIDYVLFSAYEASYMWRRQVGTDHYVDTIFHDGVDTDTTIATTAVLKSLPGVKPISGQYKAMNKVNLEDCALRKSSNWHLDTIKSVSANQLLMAIEYASFNTQSAIGLGIVSNASSGTDNCSSLTGSTSALGNATGMASETIYDVAGTETPFNTNGKVAVSYRGMENPWGNIWKHINGINLWGNGSMGGGQTYVCSDFNFDESKHSGNYESTGFTISDSSGYISAFGYGKEEYDWLFLPSETTGNSSLPVGDFAYVTPDLNGYKIFKLGSAWTTGDSAGFFDWYGLDAAGSRSYAVGGRLLYVPTAMV